MHSAKKQCTKVTHTKSNSLSGCQCQGYWESITALTNGVRKLDIWQY